MAGRSDGARDGKKRGRENRSHAKNEQGPRAGDAYVAQRPVHGVVERAIERALHLVRRVDGDIAVVNLAHSVHVWRGRRWVWGGGSGQNLKKVGRGASIVACPRLQLQPTSHRGLR